MSGLVVGLLWFPQLGDGVAVLQLAVWVSGGESEPALTLHHGQLVAPCGALGLVCVRSWLSPLALRRAGTAASAWLHSPFQTSFTHTR